MPPVDGIPLELDGAPEAVRPDAAPTTVVVVEVAPPPEPEEAVEVVVDDPFPEAVRPEEVVDVAPAEVEVLAAAAAAVVEDAGALVVVVDDVVVDPADSAGLPDPCTATPTTPATKTAVIRPPRATRGATGADLPSQTTPKF